MSGVVVGGEAWAGAAPSVGGAGLWRGPGRRTSGPRRGRREAASIIFASEPLSPAVQWETEAWRGRLHLD